jgi:hypothetical protein
MMGNRMDSDFHSTIALIDEETLPDDGLTHWQFTEMQWSPRSRGLENLALARTGAVSPG